MKFTVLTLFPELVDSFFMQGVIGRALENKVIQGESVNIRDFSTDRHRRVDDKPYGGGCGMVMTPEPLASAIKHARQTNPGSRVVFMTPQGRPFDQKTAWEMAAADKGFVLVCGRYEGVDERVFLKYVDDEISIGDYVMTGGELAAMVVIDAVARLIPGVLGGETSAEADSFTSDRLEYGQYTRPHRFEGMAVPDVLLSGNHGDVASFRKAEALKRTWLKRPDLFIERRPDQEEKTILRAWCRELEALVRD
ncbi:MAG: tRNA (guanosine(37)-N1)-methyltransferase TrmD [Pseudomonadota bacterium]